MTVKVFLILLSLISYPSVSGAGYPYIQKYSLMQGQYLIAQDTEVLFGDPNAVTYPESASISIIESNYDLKPLSPGIAFLLACLPKSTWILHFMLMGAVQNSFVSEMSLVGIMLSYNFLTIPAHLYVHDNWVKTLSLTLAKTASLSLIAVGIAGYSMIGLGCAGADTDCEEDNPTAIIVLGLIGFFGTYTYELIDAPFAAKRHNRKLQQQQGFFILPYAYKDQYQVNVGYRF